LWCLGLEDDVKINHTPVRGKVHSQDNSKLIGHVT